MFYLPEAKVSVYKEMKTPDGIRYAWYRPARHDERERTGDHIVVDAILNQQQLNQRLGRE